MDYEKDYTVYGTETLRTRYRNYSQRLPNLDLSLCVKELTITSLNNRTAEKTQWQEL